MSASADFQKGVAAFKSEDYATALRGLKPLAEQGMSHAQFFLGVAYGEGWGVPEDDKIAVKSTDLLPNRGMPGPSPIWV
jgi:TPR repeat protein